MSRWDANSDLDYANQTWYDHPREIRLRVEPTICATDGCGNQADGHKYCVRCVRVQLASLPCESPDCENERATFSVFCATCLSRHEEKLAEQRARELAERRKSA